MTDLLRSSWGSLTSTRAAEYLKTHGHAAESSKELLTDVLRELGRGERMSILDLGCGNAQLYEHLREQRLQCSYTGVDFSEPLLEAARASVGDDPAVQLVRADVNTLEGVTGSYDVAVYSHVVEMLSSPGQSVLAARRLAASIAIRFFEPPDQETTTVEVRELETGDGGTVPYLRWTMSRNYYRLILDSLGCTRADVYRDRRSTDQVHVLHFG